MAYCWFLGQISTQSLKLWTISSKSSPVVLPGSLFYIWHFFAADTGRAKSSKTKRFWPILHVKRIVLREIMETGDRHARTSRGGGGRETPPGQRGGGGGAAMFRSITVPTCAERKPAPTGNRCCASVTARVLWLHTGVLPESSQVATHGSRQRTWGTQRIRV